MCFCVDGIMMMVTSCSSASGCFFGSKYLCVVLLCDDL